MSAAKEIVIVEHGKEHSLNASREAGSNGSGDANRTHAVPSAQIKRQIINAAPPPIRDARLGQQPGQGRRYVSSSKSSRAVEILRRCKILERDIRIERRARAP
jgi:hypothetical protein